ncbi:MAG TPA: efflux transporter outer membrane subunit [Sphingomicrobium sp.]|jgi:NodT family efflux transporter outer membrane factor (OMF) lipoprotein|nr:efflux transporter outer membrane subunit [Sphingomicrobium sp.]
MTRSRATRFGRAGLLLPIFLATACASVPDLGTKPIPHSPSDYAATRSLRGETSEWPVEEWWAAYRDPQLDRLIGEGIAGSPDLAAAVARFHSAQGSAQQAGAALLPTLDATGSVSFQNQSQNIDGPNAEVPGGWHTPGTAALSINLDLDLFGKNRAALREARKNSEAARFDVEEARLLLTTGIASTYSDLAALYAQRDNLEAALDIRAQSLKMVQGRYDAGLETIDAVRLAQARIPQTRGDLASTNEAIMLDKHALAALVGEGPDRALTIERPDVGLKAQGVPANASVELIGRRPDIAAARTRVEAAAEGIKEARAAFYPNINIGALVGFQSLGIGSLFNGGSRFAGVTPAVTLPLFHGGALQGQYRGRRGQYDEAVADYDGEVVQALRETADTVTSEKQLAERLAQSRSALADYEDALRVARGRYEQGVTDYLSVLTAQESVVNARLSVAQLESRSFTLDVQLIRALGGGFDAA